MYDPTNMESLVPELTAVTYVHKRIFYILDNIIVVFSNTYCKFEMDPCDAVYKPVLQCNVFTGVVIHYVRIGIFEMEYLPSDLTSL